MMLLCVVQKETPGSHIVRNEPLSTYTYTSLYVFLAQSLSFIIIVIAIFIKIFEASKSITGIHG